MRHFTILHYRLNAKFVLVCALTKFFGINLQYASYLQDKAGLTLHCKASKVPKYKLFFIEQQLILEKKNRPISKRLQRSIKQALSLYQKNGCYRGLRMSQFLPCHGQRTKTNAKTSKAKNINRKVRSKVRKSKKHEKKIINRKIS